MNQDLRSAVDVLRLRKGMVMKINLEKNGKAEVDECYVVCTKDHEEMRIGGQEVQLMGSAVWSERKKAWYYRIHCRKGVHYRLNKYYQPLRPQRSAVKGPIKNFWIHEKYLGIV